MARGLVYILTNPCLDGWVKIGMTERNDIEARLSELNAPANLPLSFRCYAVYEVSRPREVESHIHNIIDQIDNSLHAREFLANGRIREREFFRITPEKAYGVFYEIASLRGDLEHLRLYVPTVEQTIEAEIAEGVPRRKNNSFELLGIEAGEELQFQFDRSITARVVDHKNRIECAGEVDSIYAIAKKLLVEKCGWAETTRVNGWRHFVKDGIALSELRWQLEHPPGEE